MYIVEVSLKLTPMPLSVQRKTLEDAQAVYAQVVEAMRSGSPQLLELTCEHQAEKKLALLSGEIASVQVYEKSGSAMTGKRPGFAVAE
jgi:choline dehydrogenase-like flavoprotein